MTLKLYYDLMTQPSRALYIFLQTAGISFESVVVSLRKNEQKGPEFAAVNPMCKIPVLVHYTPRGSLLVRESCTIARWLQLGRQMFILPTPILYD